MKQFNYMVNFIYTLQWDLHEMNKLILVWKINVFTCFRYWFQISHCS